MGWQNAYYGYRHFARERGVSYLTASHSIDPDYPLEFLVDNRRIPCKFATTQIDSWVRLNRGSSPDACNRLVIPEGHNLAGLDARVQHSTTGTGSWVTLGSWTLPSDGGLLDLGFSSTTVQYLRFKVDSSAKPEIPELWFTNRFTTVRGPVPNWLDTPMANVLSLDSRPGGSDTVELAGDQSVLEYVYRAAGLDEAQDLTDLEAMIAAIGETLPFLLWTVYDSDDGGRVLIVKRQGDPNARGGAKAPQTYPRAMDLTLRMREVIE